MKMKVRLTVWIAALGVMLTALTGILSVWAGSAAATRDRRETLEQIVRDRASAMDGKEALPGEISGDSGVTLTVLDGEARMLLGSLPQSATTAETSALPAPDSKTFANVKLGGRSYILFDKKADIGSEKVYVRGFIEGPTRGEIFDCTLRSWVWMLPILALLLAVGGYLIVSRALAGLEKLTADTSAIMKGSDLSRSIAYPKRKDEVWELTGAINQMLDRLEESFSNEKRLISDASHELRTPTSVILAECDVLESKKAAPTPEDYREGIATVRRQAERMKRLVSELLEFSRIDRSAVEKHYEPLDAAGLLEAVCAEQREIHGEDITLECKTESNLITELNGSLFIRMLGNLISNAYQYGKPGGHIWVTLTAGQRVDLRPTLLLSVKDDGIGIAKDQQKKVWERFYRVDPSRTDNGSSGLGLSMVKWIVSYHGGRVSLCSEEGVGSEFTVEIPLRQG